MNSYKNSFTESLFTNLQEADLQYVYRGFFSQKITDGILALTESNLDNLGESSKIKKRVFTIMVEGLQNITRHQEIEQDKYDLETGVCFIQNHNNHYYITTGNPICKESIPKLKESIEKINSLSQEELKAHYKEVLNNNTISNKGGAGLGLIEMARKSGNILLYDFVELSNDFSYFYLNMKIAQSPSCENDNKNIYSLKNIKAVHQILNNEDIILVFNGRFNQASLLNILSIIESQMVDLDINLKKKVFNTMVEMIQNIVKHGANKEEDNGNLGIFFINYKDNKYQLYTGNFVHKQDIDKLTKKIEYVNSLSISKLNAFYDKSLFDFQVDNSKGAGLGLIELRLKSQKKLNYEISNYDEDFDLFVLQVIIE